MKDSLHNSVDFLICHFTLFRFFFRWCWKHRWIRNASGLDEDECTYWIRIESQKKIHRVVTFSIIELLCSLALEAPSIFSRSAFRDVKRGEKEEGKEKNQWEFTLCVMTREKAIERSRQCFCSPRCKHEKLKENVFSSSRSFVFWSNHCCP